MSIDCTAINGRGAGRTRPSQEDFPCLPQLIRVGTNHKHPAPTLQPQGRPVVSNPAAASRPNIDPRLGLKFVAASHLIDLFEGGPVDTDLARQMAQSAIDAYDP